MNEEAVQALIEKNPKLKREKDKLLALEPGFYCIHRSWGFGFIQSYDEAENRLFIDFDEKFLPRFGPMTFFTWKVNFSRS